MKNDQQKYCTSCLNIGNKLYLKKGYEGLYCWDCHQILKSKHPTRGELQRKNQGHY